MKFDQPRHRGAHGLRNLVFFVSVLTPLACTGGGEGADGGGGGGAAGEGEVAGAGGGGNGEPPAVGGQGGEEAVGGRGGDAGSGGSTDSAPDAGSDAQTPGVTQPIRILPLGDSITQGKRHPDEATYRRPLWKKLEAAGYQVDFVGSTDQQLDGPHHYDDYDHDHEGHYGWKLTQVIPRLDGWLETYMPDIALIHLGTNDQGSSTAIQMIENMRTVIQKLRKRNPKIAIIVAKLIEPGDVGRSFSGMLPSMATGMSTNESPIYVVDQDEGFESSDTRDGIHPNPSG